ncbi:hypothetical protein TWF718_004769 [Orbilia javanica]|uniref:DUF7918 domain-containing protein n=1 Tax=Orbilia javanica TaxID=47235 RepID=A0AAN8MY90_9PEZI
MPSLKGITCTIEVGGVSAEEFGTEVEGSKITCSIVSQDDKPFTFSLDFSNSTALRHDYRLLTDGMMVATHTTTKKTARLKTSSLIINGVMERREMRFSRFETVDQKLDEMESRSHILKNMGFLEVTIHRAEKQAGRIYRGRDYKLEGIKAVHEKSLKGRAVPHKTVLGVAKYEQPNVLSTTRLDPEDQPYVTFTFRYASKSCLQSEGLIPRSPSPEPPIRDGERQAVEEMSPEALRRELLRYRARDQDERKPAKRELSPPLTTRGSTAKRDSIALEDSDSDEVVFQSERSVKKHRVTEVIDLVSDD